ncbi:MAG: hypothetical protein FWC84_06225 [Alphaproteobacteria bacterium]|nr:hypothetical protein [Alphaproteobacteria bacterium]
MSHPVFAVPSPASTPQDKLQAELYLTARRIAFELIKRRARAYAEHPLTLEVLCPGLAVASPEVMAVIARQLIETESRSPRRWFGFGGEIPLINAKAVALLARVRRRAGQRSVPLPA